MKQEPAILCDTCHKPIAEPYNAYGIPKRFCGRKCQRDWWRKVSGRQAVMIAERMKAWKECEEGTIGLMDARGHYHRI